jgi:hypothetical protein
MFIHQRDPLGVPFIYDTPQDCHLVLKAIFSGPNFGNIMHNSKTCFLALHKWTKYVNAKKIRLGWVDYSIWIVNHIKLRKPLNKTWVVSVIP